MVAEWIERSGSLLDHCACLSGHWGNSYNGPRKGLLDSALTRWRFGPAIQFGFTFHLCWRKSLLRKADLSGKWNWIIYTEPIQLTVFVVAGCLVLDSARVKPSALTISCPSTRTLRGIRLLISRDFVKLPEIDLPFMLQSALRSNYSCAWSIALPDRAAAQSPYQGSAKRE